MLLENPPDKKNSGSARARFSAEFGGDGAVRLNDPFTGGFISRFHYRRHRIPWVQCEVNRSLYESVDGGVDSEKIEAVWEAVFRAVTGFWEDEAVGLR